eukprot:GHRQ01004425.1.p2 GENE.GHRQ01004425.1~~GHRQ01004425.1.p2  ORF type:complete len:222 (+),score=109.85 GHRQ01004425.1:165-830(+)
MRLTRLPMLHCYPLAPNKQCRQCWQQSAHPALAQSCSATADKLLLLLLCCCRPRVPACLACCVRSAADVAALLAGVQYSGLTPLATSLANKVLGPIVYSLAGSGQLAKPVLVLTITDGEPTDNPRDLVVQVIKEARNRLSAQYGPKAVAFEFAQVGKDQRAQAFLGQLDKHPEVGSSIDCTSYFELESAEYQRRGIQLSPEMWLVKMMVGSIDPTYDEGDE